MLQQIQEQINLRICEESIPRIQHCVHQLPAEALNHAPNSHMNAIGNLILHLDGNVRQWLLKEFLGVPFNRNRVHEFSARAISKETCLAILNALQNDIQEHLPLLSEKLLAANYNIQGIASSGIGVVVHVIEHFSYHTGQIALLTKQLINKDLGFYKDHKNLES